MGTRRSNFLQKLPRQTYVTMQQISTEGFYRNYPVRHTSECSKSIVFLKFIEEKTPGPHREARIPLVVILTILVKSRLCSLQHTHSLVSLYRKFAPDQYYYVKSICHQFFLDWFLPYPHCGSTYLNIYVCRFESSQKDESRAQSTDSSKACRKPFEFLINQSMRKR